MAVAAAGDAQRSLTNSRDVIVHHAAIHSLLTTTGLATPAGSITIAPLTIRTFPPIPVLCSARTARTKSRISQFDLFFATTFSGVSHDKGGVRLWRPRSRWEANMHASTRRGSDRGAARQNDVNGDNRLGSAARPFTVDGGSAGLPPV